MSFLTRLGALLSLAGAAGASLVGCNVGCADCGACGIAGPVNESLGFGTLSEGTPVAEVSLSLAGTCKGTGLSQLVASRTATSSVTSAAGWSAPS